MVPSRNVLTLILLISLSLIFLTRFIFLGHAIYGDGIYYWAYTRSLVVDQNLDLTNESKHAYSPDGNNSYDPKNSSPGRQLTDDKYYPIGVSILWTPAFLSAHLLSGPLGYLKNGYSDIYQVAVGILNISFVSVAVLLIWKTLRREYSSFVSITSISLLVFATNLLYYASLDVLNTHSAALLLTSIAVYFLFSKRELGSKNVLALGIVTGLCTLIRPQDALFGLLFLPEIVKSKSIRLGLIFFAGAFLAFLPQLLASLTIFGSIFRLPYVTGSNTFNPLDPHLFELFFDRSRGLLYFSPIYIASLAGLVLYFKNKNIYSGRLLLLVILEILVVSVWSGWAQGESFGLRMFISLIPIFAIGLSEVLNYAQKYLSNSAIIAIVTLFILQNFLMIAAFHVFLHEPTYAEGELSKGGKIKQEILLKLGPQFN